MNWHSGIQPFQCPESGCKARFAGRLALQRHVKYKHMKTLQAYEIPVQFAEMCRNGVETEDDTEKEDNLSQNED